MPPVGHPLFGERGRLLLGRAPAGRSPLAAEHPGVRGAAPRRSGGMALAARRAAARARSSRPSSILVLGAAFLCSLSPEWRLGGGPCSARPACCTSCCRCSAPTRASQSWCCWRRRSSPAARRRSLIRRSRRSQARGPRRCSSWSPWSWPPSRPGARRDVLPTTAHRWLSGRAGSPGSRLRVADRSRPRVCGGLLRRRSQRSWPQRGVRRSGPTRGTGRPRYQPSDRPTRTLLSTAGSSRPVPPPGLAPFQGFEDARVLTVEAAGDSPRADLRRRLPLARVQRLGNLPLDGEGGTPGHRARRPGRGGGGARADPQRLSGSASRSRSDSTVEPIGRLAVGTEPAPLPWARSSLRPADTC